MSREVDLERVKPYADHLGDGIVQFSFTLPVPYGLAARKAAQELAQKMGFEHPEVVHYQGLTEGYTYFVMFGECTATVDYATLSDEGFEIEYMSEDQIEAFAKEQIGRPIVIVGAATGTDTHSVGIDAMLNLKGFHGHHGLEGYRAFETHNLGSQVPNSVLVARAIELGADAILVSQTVTQQNLHINNLTELVEIVEAEGRRGQMILTCGGPRVSNELAKELGYDAGFSKGTYPYHVASFIVRELAARTGGPRSAVRPDRAGAASGTGRTGEEHRQDGDSGRDPEGARGAGEERRRYFDRPRRRAARCDRHADLQATDCPAGRQPGGEHRRAVRASGLAHERLAQTGVRTPLGEVVIARLAERGAVEVAGPSAGEDLSKVSEQMIGFGAERVLIDGSIDRRAASSPAVADGLVIATGAVLSEDIEAGRRGYEGRRRPGQAAGGSEPAGDTGALDNVATRELMLERRLVLNAEPARSPRC